MLEKNFPCKITFCQIITKHKRFVAKSIEMVANEHVYKDISSDIFTYNIYFDVKYRTICHKSILVSPSISYNVCIIGNNLYAILIDR